MAKHETCPKCEALRVKCEAVVGVLMEADRQLTQRDARIAELEEENKQLLHKLWRIAQSKAAPEAQE